MSDMKYIDTKKIQAFVTRVEKKKKYKRNAGLIMRHLTEEIGELSAALWRHETGAYNLYGDSKERTAAELVDVISLSVYMADVLSIDLNKAFPKRIDEVARQYGVKGVSYDPS